MTFDDYAVGNVAYIYFELNFITTCSFSFKENFFKFKEKTQRKGGESFPKVPVHVHKFAFMV